MVNLQALNMSGTNISDEFLKVLTYGVRLQSWAAEQNLTATSCKILDLINQLYGIWRELDAFHVYLLSN